MILGPRKKEKKRNMIQNHTPIYFGTKYFSSRRGPKGENRAQNESSTICANAIL